MFTGAYTVVFTTLNQISRGNVSYLLTCFLLFVSTDRTRRRFPDDDSDRPRLRRLGRSGSIEQSADRLVRDQILLDFTVEITRVL